MAVRTLSFASINDISTGQLQEHADSLAHSQILVFVFSSCELVFWSHVWL